MNASEQTSDLPCDDSSMVSPEGTTSRSSEARFLDWLVDAARITGLTLERVKRVQRETGDRLASVLLKLGLLSEASLVSDLADFTGYPRWKIPAQPPRPDIDFLSSTFLRDKELAFIDRRADHCAIACWDALDNTPARALQFSLGCDVHVSIGSRSEILAWLAEFCPLPVANALENVRSGDSEDEEIDRLKDLASDAPIIRLVQQLLEQAVDSHASDIHVEASETGLLIRYRQDGMLREVARHAKSIAGSIVSRIKVLSSLNIAETRLPQDGRLRITVQGKEVDFRVASSPGLHGESLVLRILDRKDVALDFQALGFDAPLLHRMRDALAQPHGIILVTGPTGSGKTTTLYAALKEINIPDRKLLSVEDPVEYVLEGVTQVPVRPQIGLTFAQALRSFLRQDPDVLMVGEIRDAETAEIAVQAALTGHLLLSTLHTNSASAAMSRLLDMGVDDFLLTSTLRLVLGQRLVRRLCVRCRLPFEPSPELRARAKLSDSGIWYRPRGCDQCRESGFRGRTAIVEALPLSGALRAAVMAHQDAHAIERIAIDEGMRTMFEHGMSRVARGETTYEEVLRVTSIN